MAAPRGIRARGDRPAAAVARPLRWWKFSVLLFPAAASIARGWSALHQLVGIWRSGYGAVGSPPGILAGAAVALVGMLALAALAADAGWDRRMPRRLVVAAILCSLVPLPGVQSQEVDEALRRCGVLLARQLHLSGTATLPPGCERPLVRDRWLRPVPIRLIEARDAAAPVRGPPDGATPGTLVVARKGGLGWVTAVGLGSEGPAMVRDGDGLWIAGFTEGGME